MHKLPEQNHSRAVFEALGTGPFACLDAAERRRLAAHARIRPFAKGDILFREGQAAADPALLLCGLVKLSSLAPRGRECVLHVVRPGRLLDAGVLFYEGGLPASAVGVKSGRMLCLERGALLEALTRNAKLGLALLAALCLRQRLLINKIAGSQGRISVRRRVAAWLLHRAKMEKSRELEISVTRDVLASQIGISRESLCRGLSALGAEGLITPERRRIVLLDPATLQKLAED